MLKQIDGFKIGMDRLGNPIRIKSESIQVVNSNGETVPDFKYYGAHKKEWYRKLVPAEKLTKLTASFSKAESTKIEDYKYKESFDSNTTSSYYTNDTSVIFDGTNDYIEIANTSPSTTVILVPSAIPSILKTASTVPNSKALAPELTFST